MQYELQIIDKFILKSFSYNSSIEISFKLFLTVFICVHVCAQACDGVYMEVRGQLLGGGPFLPPGRSRH